MAYACSPERGSEAAVGWNRALESARHFDTWVLCEEHEFGPEIRRYCQSRGTPPGLHFVFIPLHPWERFLGGTQLSWYLVLRRWHRRAYRAARRLHQQLHFDLVHQATFCGFREPGYLWKLDAPFLWGPIGGTQNYPWRFLPQAGARAGSAEALRNVCNWLQLRLSPRVRRAANKAAVLLAANTTCQHDIGRSLGRTPLRLVETGINQVAAAPPARADDGVLRILWSGHLFPRKALHLLIEALARLPAEVRYELRILGRGTQEARWRRLARRQGVDRHTTWLGWLPFPQALEQYAWADLFAFTSLRDTSGNVFLEALSRGLPVVCLDHQGARDVITADCGVKIAVTRPEQVIEDLAEAILRLARDPDERRRLAQGALQRARQYLWSRQGQRMTAFYRQAMTTAGGNGAAVEAGGESLSFPRRSPLAAAAHWLKRRVAARGALVLDRLLPARPAAGFAILMYHRVCDRTKGVPAPTWNVTPGRFRQQLAGLLARGYQAWPLAKVLAYHRAGQPIPPRTFVVSFDDGYECVYRQAWPILKELGVPATIFLATAYLDGRRPLPFDDWPAAGSSRADTAGWRPLSTAQCAEMLSGGLVALGAHSHSHADFRRRPETFRRDLAEPLAGLQRRFALAEAPFAFPFGFADDELVAVARESGVLCALSDENELNSPASDRHCWGRVIVEQGDTAAMLAAKIDGWYSFLRRVWLRAWRRTAARAGRPPAPLRPPAAGLPQPTCGAPVS
jgi:glycosyltransferase involved in cell wall biosynthesis/peptidoglycan/xylan/chitin deacetylase (PgdA/CDA1 family)